MLHTCYPLLDCLTTVLYKLSTNCQQQTVGLLWHYCRTTVRLLSDYRNVGLSDHCRTTVGHVGYCRTVGPSVGHCRTLSDILSDCRTMRERPHRGITVGQCRTTVGHCRTVGLSDCRTVGLLSDYCRKPLSDWLRFSA